MKDKTMYVEPTEYLPKDIRKKYGLGEYAKEDNDVIKNRLKKADEKDLKELNNSK